MTGTSTSSAVPKMPSGPARTTRIELALSVLGLMFLSVVNEKSTLPAASGVSSEPGVGLMPVTCGPLVSTTNWTVVPVAAGFEALPLASTTTATAV